MTKQAVSLMDVLAPPGNHWLMALARRKSALPAGVRIVRFDDGDEDVAEDVAEWKAMPTIGAAPVRRSEK